MMEEERIAAEIEMEKRITVALEAVPAVRIPEDFTARMVASMPAKRPLIAEPRTHYGRNVMVLCAVLLCVVLLASAKAVSSGSVAWVAAQSFLLAELGAIALWLTLRSRSKRL